MLRIPYQTESFPSASIIGRRGRKDAEFQAFSISRLTLSANKQVAVLVSVR